MFFIANHYSIGYYRNYILLQIVLLCCSQSKALFLRIIVESIAHLRFCLLVSDTFSLTYWREEPLQSLVLFDGWPPHNPSA